MPAPGAIRHVLETCLYVQDMAQARAFYEEVMGLKPHFGDDRMAGYRLGDTMLLLFRKGGTLKPVEMPSGTIPPHDGSGPVHFALSVDGIDAWRAHLGAKGVEIESRVEWPKWKSESLYFRDPDGHLVELATPGLWGID